MFRIDHSPHSCCPLSHLLSSPPPPSPPLFSLCCPVPRHISISSNSRVVALFPGSVCECHFHLIIVVIVARHCQCTVTLVNQSCVYVFGYFVNLIAIMHLCEVKFVKTCTSYVARPLWSYLKSVWTVPNLHFVTIM